MCKHEFEQFCIGRPTTWGLQTLRFADLCVFCGESRYETNLKQQLAAANAELAAEKLSNQIDAACAEQFQSAMQRAEQAEALCAKYHVALLKIKTWCGEPMHYDGVELQYVLNIAKAALEEKP